MRLEIVLLVAAVVVCGVDHVPNLTFLRRRVLSEAKVRVEGPAMVDETVGELRLYAFRADWNKVIQQTRNRLKGKAEEEPGERGALIPLCGTDVRFAFDGGTTIGFVRDFRASPQKLGNPFVDASHLTGRHLRGWVTVLAFDGVIRTKAKYRSRVGLGS